MTQKNCLTLNQIIKFQKTFWAEKNGIAEKLLMPIVIMQLMEQISEMEGGPEFLIKYGDFMEWCEKRYKFVGGEDDSTE
jgi:hypothetical protein